MDQVVICAILANDQVLRCVVVAIAVDMVHDGAGRQWLSDSSLRNGHVCADFTSEALRFSIPDAHHSPSHNRQAIQRRRHVRGATLHAFAAVIRPRPFVTGRAPPWRHRRRRHVRTRRAELVLAIHHPLFGLIPPRRWPQYARVNVAHYTASSTMPTRLHRASRREATPATTSTLSNATPARGRRLAKSA